jgi:topoisomerase IA-like protein
MMPESLPRDMGSHLRESRMISESGQHFSDYTLRKSRDCKSQESTSQGKRDPG